MKRLAIDKMKRKLKRYAILLLIFGIIGAIGYGQTIYKETEILQVEIIK